MIHLVLWGAGGHAKVVLDVALAMGGFAPISFVDDSQDANRLSGCCHLGNREALLTLDVNASCNFLVSIGHNRVRADCYRQGLRANRAPATLIHPSAIISASALIGGGTVIMPRVVINANAEVGQNCIINTGTVVEHDCTVGDHVHLSPGVLLGGGAKVHSYAHMGLGAIALPQAEIGEGAIIGAGAVVLDSIPPGVTAIGVPARITSYYSSPLTK